MKKSILWLSESPFNSTGYGIVTENLTKLLGRHGYKIYILAGNYDGKEILIDENRTLLSGGQNLAKDNHGNDRLLPYINALKPNILFTLYDSFVLRTLFNKEISGMDYFNYLVIDSDDQYLEDSYLTGVPIVMSNFAKDVYMKNNDGKVPEVLYHGVDVNVFKPYPQDIRNGIRKKLGLKEDSFVFGSVNTNMERKRWDLLFMAFKKFLKMVNYKKNIYLYCHTVKRQSYGQGFDLLAIADYLGISDRVVFTPNLDYVSLPDRIIAQIYNIFDVHVSATMGEGFGLSTLEAMACGIPNIITDCTSNTELVKGRGVLVPTKTKVFWRYNTTKHIVDVNSFANAMFKLYKNDELRKQYRKEGIKFARKHTWEDAARQLHDIFNKYEGEYGDIIVNEKISKNSSKRNIA